MNERSLLFLALSLLMSACGSNHPGIQDHLSAAMSRSQTTTLDASGLHFTRQDGAQVVLTRAYLCLGAVTLESCPSSMALRILRALSPLSTAQAHTLGSPTKLGTPHVLSALSGPSDSLALGTLAPPPGKYCGLTLDFDAADSDAEGLPSDADVVDRTLWVDGTLTPPGGAPQDFHLETEAARSVPLTFPELALSSSVLEGSQTVTFSPEHWLDGVDPLAASAADEVLAAIASSTSVQ
jgi:hypothetical protein